MICILYRALHEIVLSSNKLLEGEANNYIPRFYTFRIVSHGEINYVRNLL